MLLENRIFFLSYMQLPCPAYSRLIFEHRGSFDNINRLRHADAIAESISPHLLCDGENSSLGPVTSL